MTSSAAQRVLGVLHVRIGEDSCVGALSQALVEEDVLAVEHVRWFSLAVAVGAIAQRIVAVDRHTAETTLHLKWPNNVTVTCGASVHQCSHSLLRRLRDDRQNRRVESRDLL